MNWDVPDLAARLVVGLRVAEQNRAGETVIVRIVSLYVRK